MGRLSEAIEADEVPMGRKHGLETILESLPDEDADELRQFLEDRTVNAMKLHRSVTAAWPELPWPTRSCFQRWVQEWRDGSRRY